MGLITEYLEACCERRAGSHPQQAERSNLDFMMRGIGIYMKQSEQRWILFRKRHNYLFNTFTIIENYLS
jgi:hypothetical protein